MAADSQDKNIKSLINEIKRKVSLVCSNIKMLKNITISINAIFCFKQFNFDDHCVIIMTIAVIIDDYRHNNEPTRPIIQFQMMED